MSHSPKHYILIPGSFHGAWCWYKMIPLLSKNGNTCEAIDLPGGRDGKPANQVSLSDYTEAVSAAIAKYEKPVVLVGHSRAGIVISSVAEKAPDKIEQLVYLCAFLIPDGEPMIATALSDSASVLAANLIINEAEGWHIPKTEAYREIFYHDCTEEDVALSASLLHREPMPPLVTPLQLSDARFGSVKKVYIHTTDDKATTYDLQKRMVDRTRVDSTFELQASHSPFLSKPGELAEILLGL